MLHRRMLTLINVAQGHSSGIISGRKTQAIGLALCRQSLASAGVADIAEIPELIIRGRDFIARCAAGATKAGAKGQARREGPRDGVNLFDGKKERTSHSTAILCAAAVDCVEFFHPMSDTDRLTMLTRFLEQNPGDAFARYGLAMEYSKSGETEQALEQFGKLLQVHPDYTNGYFMAAQTLERAGRTAEARKMLENGIEAARRTGNRHALSEMTGMLDELSA
jgi:Tetratricopeptide repeat